MKPHKGQYVPHTIIKIIMANAFHLHLRLSLCPVFPLTRFPQQSARPHCPLLFKDHSIFCGCSPTATNNSILGNDNSVLSTPRVLLCMMIQSITISNQPPRVILWIKDYGHILNNQNLNLFKKNQHKFSYAYLTRMSSPNIYLIINRGKNSFFPKS